MLRDVLAKSRLFTVQRSGVNVNQSRLNRDGEKDVLRQFGRSRQIPLRLSKRHTDINILSRNVCASNKLLHHSASNPAPHHHLGLFDSLRWRRDIHNYACRNTRTNTNVVIFHPLIFGKARQLPIGGNRESHFHLDQDARNDGIDAVKRVSTLTCLGSASWYIDPVLFREIYTEDAVPQVPLLQRVLMSLYDLIKGLVSKMNQILPEWKSEEIQAPITYQTIASTLEPSADISLYMFCKQMNDDITARHFRYLCHVLLLTFLGATTVVTLTLISIRVIAAVLYFLVL